MTAFQEILYRLGPLCFEILSNLDGFVGFPDELKTLAP